jgi:hypothetical protein
MRPEERPIVVDQKLRGDADLGRDAMHRAIRALEKAGAIRVERANGSGFRVDLLLPPAR